MDSHNADVPGGLYFVGAGATTGSPLDSWIAVFTFPLADTAGHSGITGNDHLNVPP